MNPVRVTVLMGGPDAEREVSICSGTRVADALGRCPGFAVQALRIDKLTSHSLARVEGDVIFPVLHGPWGEGGPLQELLEHDGRPFVGSRSAGAAMAMDKAATKSVAGSLGVQTPAAQVIRSVDDLAIAGPVVLKPIDDGSSVDLRICRDRAATEAAAAELLGRRRALLVERYIHGREITVGILHGRALPVIEIVPGVEFYDYEAKYRRNDTQYLFDTLPAVVAEQAQQGALAVFGALALRDLARADFMVDSAGAWFLEINTMPGMTDHSLLPKAAARMGLSFERVCSGAVEAALARIGLRSGAAA